MAESWSADGVVTKAGGIRLHVQTNHEGSTVYTGVRQKRGHGNYEARCRDESLGTFRSPVLAALAYAKAMGEAPELKEKRGPSGRVLAQARNASGYENVSPVLNKDGTVGYRAKVKRNGRAVVDGIYTTAVEAADQVAIFKEEERAAFALESSRGLQAAACG